MLQQLASFPGLKTGRGYSAVVLDRFQARPALRRFSIPGCWEGLGTRQLLEQHALLSLMSWAYSTCAVFGLLFQQRAGSGVTFDSTFLFEARPLFAWVTSRTRLCHIDDRPPKLHFENFNIDYPWPQIYFRNMAVRNTSLFSNFSQRDYRYSTNTKFTVRRTNTYTHTYIHTYIQTDTARVQHVNVGLAQARPN